MSTHDVRSDELPAGANDAAEIAPIPAATVLVLRGAPLEVLMMRRHAKSSFVPGTWVFPGGALDAADSTIARAIAEPDDETAMRVCAVRELFEEAGLWLGGTLADPAALRQQLIAESGALVAHSAAIAKAIEQLTPGDRWITPVGVPKRFDTWFYYSTYSGGSEIAADNHEAVEIRWIAPAAALAAHERGEMPMVFPTIKNLALIKDFATPDDVLRWRASQPPRIIRPVLGGEGKNKRIMLPDEP